VYLRSAKVVAAAPAPAVAAAVPQAPQPIEPPVAKPEPVQEAPVAKPAEPVIPAAVPFVAPPPPPPAPKPEPVIRKTRVLIVEDEPGIRALMRKILQREGYDVLEAGSGPEALDLLKKTKDFIDLLITDVLMPGMTGRQLATQIQGMDERCAILYMSGFTADTGVETGQFPPGSHFLQKPFTLGSLLRKVNEVLSAAPRG